MSSGEETITPETSVIQGTITGLQRGMLVHGPLFDMTVERIAALFSSYSLEELEQAKLDMAPTELAVSLEPLLRKLDGQAKEWKPAMLQQLADELPGNTPLAVYGRGPGWLYGMLAAHAGQRPFYQFDPRIGWLAPPTLKISPEPTSEEILVRPYEYEDSTILSTRIVTEYLDYLQTEYLPFPPIPTERGLILDGKIPHWLLTALVRLYIQAGVAWIACYQPQLKGAVVVASSTTSHRLGGVIPMQPVP